MATTQCGDYIPEKIKQKIRHIKENFCTVNILAKFWQTYVYLLLNSFEKVSWSVTVVLFEFFFHFEFILLTGFVYITR